MMSHTAVETFRTVRAETAEQFKTADLATVCAAWVANQRKLDGVPRAFFTAEALAVRDALKEAAQRCGIVGTMVDDYIDRWAPHLRAA